MKKEKELINLLRVNARCTEKVLQKRLHTSRTYLKRLLKKLDGDNMRYCSIMNFSNLFVFHSIFFFSIPYAFHKEIENISYVNSLYLVNGMNCTLLAECCFKTFKEEELFRNFLQKNGACIQHVFYVLDTLKKEEFILR